MDTRERYNPKSFWDAKARASADFESAVCLNDPIANKIIDRIQKRCIRLAFQKISERMDLAGRKLLDYGCGTGRWVAFFRNYGIEYTGVDISTEMIRLASARFQDVDFSTVENDGIRFPPQTFDIACSIAVIHHNQYEMQSSILRQLSYAIKPKGFLVLFESIGPLNPGGFVEFPQPWEDWKKILENFGFIHFWSKQTRYFSTQTIMNKVVGENRLPQLSNSLGCFLDPYIGSFLPSRLRTRAAMIFQKLAE